MKWAGNVARMGEARNLYQILARQPDITDLSIFYFLHLMLQVFEKS
jgi:hypothetical protein